MISRNRAREISQAWLKCGSRVTSVKYPWRISHSTWWQNWAASAYTRCFRESLTITEGKSLGYWWKNESQYLLLGNTLGGDVDYTAASWPIRSPVEKEFLAKAKGPVEISSPKGRWNLSQKCLVRKTEGLCSLSKDNWAESKDKLISHWASYKDSMETRDYKVYDIFCFWSGSKC